MNERGTEQQADDYLRSWAAKQRILADPGRMAMLRRKLAELRERVGR